MGLLFQTALAAPQEKKPADSGRYAINLASYEEPVDPATIPALEVFAKYRLYSTTVKSGGMVWHRLRLGFFSTEKEARRVMDRLLDRYPEAWVTVVRPEEKAGAEKLALKATGRVDAVPGRPTPPAVKGVEAPKEAVAPPVGAPAGAAPSVAAPEPGEAGAAPEVPAVAAPETGEAVSLEEKLLEEARKAMATGEYQRALKLYTTVIKSGNPEMKRQAQELVGVAYEKMGNLDKARAEYKAFLLAYPEGEDSQRVRQRLASLDTAVATPREKLKTVKRQEEARTELYGSFSQFYNRNESFTDLGGNIVTRSTVTNDLDLTFRRRSAAYDFSTVAVGGYELDLLETNNSRTRVSRLYLDLLDRNRGLSFRGGRQSQSTGGVQGLFDGAAFGYQVLSFAKANAVAGYPADSSVFERINTDRWFWGANIDLGTFARSLDFNIFYITQRADGLKDREAVGAEARYFHPERSFFTLVDYDLHFSELNSVFLTGNVTLPGSTVFSLSADYRNSPLLTTTNALQGQTVTSLTELRAIYGDDGVRQLAKDRTARSRSLTLSATRPVSEKLQVGGDFTVSRLSGTPASGGVEATTGTGYEYFYSVQLIGSSLLREGDVAILGLMYTNTDAIDTASLNINTRYPVNRAFRINPRLRFDFSRNDSTGSEQLKVRPALRTDYYWSRYLWMEIEGGADWTYEWIASQTNEYLDYYVTAGYRLDF